MDPRRANKFNPKPQRESLCLCRRILLASWTKIHYWQASSSTAYSMSSSVLRAAVRAQLVYRKRGLPQRIYNSRNRMEVRTVATTSLASDDRSTSNPQYALYALAAAAAAIASLTVASTTTTTSPTSCDSAAKMNHPKASGDQQLTRLPTIPRNVNLKKMRSLKGRSLEDKYTVDWETVLGEGAYGSVHPARLKSTGEKVALKKISRRYTTSTGFKTETSALLRIYDQGGHPNISGLRDMVCQGVRRKCWRWLLWI